MPFHVLASASAKIIRKRIGATDPKKKRRKEILKIVLSFHAYLGLHHHVTLSPFMFNTN